MSSIFGKTNTKTTQTQQLDPRMQALLYGDNGSGGIFGAARNMFEQNPSGMNDTMRQGLNMQRSALTDPAMRQSNELMRGSGMQLMQRGVAGNPFLSGGRFGSQEPSFQPSFQTPGFGRGLPNDGQYTSVPEASKPMQMPMQAATPSQPALPEGFMSWWEQQKRRDEESSRAMSGGDGGTGY